VGNQRSARIQPDGTFRADRVPVGENAIRLVNAPIQLTNAGRLFGGFDTPVRRVIADQPENTVTIDLLEEAVRFQASRSKRNDRQSQDDGAVP
jgi:hypothetical protein